MPRPQLLGQFEEWQRTPLTLISAPTGYGKTALVSSWLETMEFPNAWVTLDEGDDNLVQFLNCFLAAIRSIFPEAVEDTLVPSNGSEQPPVQALANSLINDLDQITADYALVLDNYHAIAQMDNHEIVSALLLTPPPSLHLVLCTRFDPPLDLSSLRAKNRLMEIRARELCPVQAEVAE